MAKGNSAIVIPCEDMLTFYKRWLSFIRPLRILGVELQEAMNQLRNAPAWSAASYNQQPIEQSLTDY